MAHTPTVPISKENIPGRLFGTSGIRGLVNEFLTPELAVRVGLSFASMLENRGTVLVGRDVRLNSQLLQNAIISGLSAGGVDSVDCGVVPTPAVLFALRKFKFQAGVMVTGSHTPPPITGILFFLEDTGEMDSRGERRIEQVLSSEGWRRLPWNELGSFSTLEVTEIYLEEVRKELGHVGNYRVITDPGNGSACTTLGRVLESLGCEVVTINGRPDGRFPSRSPYPQPSTLGQLASAVKDAKADLGVGTDSDGDRALFVTDRGEILWGDKSGALFTRNELKDHGGGRVITTVNTSNLIHLLCREYRGSVTVTRVGPPAIAQALREHLDAIFAVEESGKYIWPKILRYGDAALASGKLLQIMKSEHKSLDELQRELPKLHSAKCAIPCPDDLKLQVLDFALDVWKERKDVEISTIDGFKASYPNGSWFLVRASGTEPAIRCHAESPDSDEAKKLLDMAAGLVRNAIRRVSEVRKL